MAGSKDGRKSAITATCQNIDEMVAEFCRSAIPLVKRSGIYLMPFGHADDERFARNFRETWRLMGKDGRRSLTDYWRNPDPMRWVPQILSPGIELLDDWSGRDDDDFGYCTNNGHKFMFWACGVDAMPDDIVQTLIAHELGHAYRCAIGEHIIDPANLPTESDRIEEEMNTRLTVECLWGFDEEALSEWLTHNLDAVMRDYKARMSD